MNKNMFKRVISSLFISLIFTLSAIMICALLITYTNFSEEYVGKVSVVISCICSFYMGLRVAKSADKKGMVWGIISSVFYMVSVYALLNLFGEFEKNISEYYVGIIISVLFGAAGGILGINTKK